MNKKDFLFLLHQYRGQDYVDIYPFNADNRKIELYFRETLEKVEEQHKYHKQLEIQLKNKIEDFVRSSESTLDSHINDNTKHITATERNSWNAKETVSGAREKATQALNAAKKYTNEKIEEIGDIDTTFLETKEDAAKKLDQAKSYTDKHKQRTDNPHRVTKAQVGLSNVDNVKQATKSEFDTHASNNNNPHKVTKSQIGLGNVPNYGIASIYEAEQGVKNTALMTPLRTKQAIEKQLIPHEDTKATWKNSGHVTLRDSVTSNLNENSGVAATPYAVKRAYDRASEALTLGNRRKKEVVDGLLSVNESLPITQSSSWDTVIRNIENAGIPYVVTEFFDEGILNVKNLNFTPDVFAILSKPDYRQTPSIIIKKDRDGKIFYQLTNDSNVIRIYKDGFDVRDALSLLGYSGGHLIALGTGIAKELGYNLKIEN